MTREIEWTQDERDRAQQVMDADARALTNQDTSITDRMVTPETARVMPDGVRRQEWRECRECTREVPEAGPVKRPGDD